MIDDEDNIGKIRSPKTKRGQARYPRRRVGPPRKVKRRGIEYPGSKTFQVAADGSHHERVQPYVRMETKRWLEKIAAKHWSSIGQLIDDMVEAAKLGEAFVPRTYTPAYILKAERAKIKREKRLEAVRKKDGKGKINVDPYQATPDDGSEREF